MSVLNLILMKTAFGKWLALAFVGLTFAGSAMAHTGHSHGGGFGGGFYHPFLGLDHILAMVAVGLWAFQMRGTAIWVLPGSFLVAMLAGFGLGLSPVMLPVVEPGILASVILLGVMVAMAVRMPMVAAASMTAIFGILHGFAHGMEMPAFGSVALYAAGFAAGTAILHAAGIGLGSAGRLTATSFLPRAAGAAIVALGLIQVVA